MGKETDEFGAFVETPTGDDFGEFVSTEKKNGTNQPATTSTSSTAPVQQPTTPTAQNGTPNLLQEANTTFKAPDEQGLTNGQVVGKPTDKKEKLVALAEKANQRNKVVTEVIQDHNVSQSNSRDPKVKELQDLYNQLDNLRNGTNVVSGVTEADIMQKINSLSNEKVQAQNVGVDQNGNPIEKKAPYATYGDMYDATLKAATRYNENRNKLQQLDVEINPAIQQYRNDAGYKMNATDAQGNEYYRMNPMESFAQGVGNSLDVIGIGLQNLSGDKQGAMDAIKQKWVLDNVIYPKQTGEAGFSAEGLANAAAKGTEMLGGVAPLVAGSALTGGTGTLGAAATSALLFGAQDYGGTLYQSYSEAKAANPDISDEEAMQLAEKNANFAGTKGLLLGGTMGLQGAAGRSLFLNNAERGAFKTFLAEQGVMAPAFGLSKAIQNIHEDKPVTEGVVQSMEDAVIIGGMTHAIGAGMKLPEKLRTTFENTVAKNYGQLATTINDAVQSGAMDFAAAQNIAERAKAFDVVGKDNPPAIENKLVEQGIALNDVANKIEQVKKANPLADTSHLDVEAERINKEIAETKGTPLSDKEQKEYEKLIEKRDAKPIEGAEKPKLLPSEKEQIRHYEARMKSADKQEEDALTEKLKQFPLPDKDVTEMNSTELNNYAAKIEAHNKELGKIKEEDLTDKQKELYGGKNLPEGVYDPTELRRMANRTEGLEQAENAQDISEWIKRPLLKFAKDKDAESLGVLKAAQRRAVELGIEPAELFGEIEKTIREEYKADADFILSNIAESLKTEPNEESFNAKEIEAGTSENQKRNQQTSPKGVLTENAQVEQPATEVPAVEQATEVAAIKNFTDAKVANESAKKLTEKIGEKESKKYFEQVNRLFNPNQVEIIEYRPNGVVTKEGDAYIFHALSDMESKNWRVSFKRDISEQFTSPEKVDVKPTTKAKLSQSDIPEKGGEIKVGDYTVKTEAIEMPDGEAGMNVSITKPNGEVVDIGNQYTEDVASEVNKKLRGFTLSETPQTPKEETAKEPTKKEGEEITFEQAGSDRTGKIVSIDEKGNYKVKGNDGANYTVSPDKARTPEVVAEAKKSVKDNMKTLQELSKPKSKEVKSNIPKPKEAAIIPSDLITAPMKLLGMGDKYAANFTKKIEDGVGRSFRAAMGNSNKALSRSASEAQGLFKMIALTTEDITKRRLGLGAMSAAPLKAVNFYKNAVDIVGKTPESLRNVHQVLDPEVYTARGETPLDETGLSPAEKNLYDLLKTMNNMVHDWHYANGRITEETYLKNKDKYAPRFYEENEFEGYPDDLKASFEEYANQQNFSYVKERKNFADVMGENTIIEDPAYGTAMRLAQMMRNEAVMDYAKDVNSREKTYAEGDKDIPNSYVQLKGGGKFGNINTYGELTNRYVPRDVAEDFKGYFFINDATEMAYKALKGYNRFAPVQFLKKTKTLYNPITQLGNIGSNYVFALMNGIDPLTFQTRKFEAAKEVKEKGPIYLKLVEEGVLGTDVTTKDLKEAAKEAPNKTGLRAAISKIDDKIQDFYGSRDEIAKVAAYLAHTKDYGRSEKEAIDRVYSGFQNYNNVGRFYDFGSKIPVIGNPFIKFKGDLVRIMKNNYSQRPLTNIALLAALSAIAGAFSKWSNEEEDVREARERRRFIPKIPLPNALGGDIPLVWQTPYGEINAARYFAPGSIYDMGEKTTTAEQVSDYLPLQVDQTESGIPFPAKIQDPFLGPFVQLVFDKDFRGMPILDPEKNKWNEGNATKEEKIQNALTFIARQDIPFFDKIDDANRALNGEPDYYGRNKSLKQALMGNILKVEQFGKPEAIENLSKEVDARLHKMDALDKDIKAAKNLAEKNIVKINASSATPEQKKAQVAHQYERAQDKINEILNEQARIKTQLLDPETLLKKLGAPIPDGEKEKDQRPKRPERPTRPTR